MLVERMDGDSFQVTTEEHLRFLLDGRSEEFDSFMLTAEEDQPWLWVHFNGRFASVHYFPGQQGHPGFQPCSMTPAGCPSEVEFRQSLDAGDAIFVPNAAVVSAEVACKAAVEFLLRAELPPSVEWFEL